MGKLKENDKMQMSYYKHVVRHLLPTKNLIEPKMIGAMFGSILDPDSLRITIMYIVIMLKPDIMLAIDRTPALMIAILIFLPESPYWLIEADNVEGAK